MNAFSHSFLDGMSHIFCLDAADHILFLLALVARFDYTKLKHVFWMVTAFTIGHAISFVLAALDIMPSVRAWAETAIPITIALTAIFNLVTQERKEEKYGVSIFVYLIALFFGGIHGLAIGSMLKMKIITGNLIPQLLGFNLGIELAQIIVVIGIMLFQFLLASIFNVKLKAWRIGASVVALGLSIMMLFDKLAT